MKPQSSIFMSALRRKTRTLPGGIQDLFAHNLGKMLHIDIKSPLGEGFKAQVSWAATKGDSQWQSGDCSPGLVMLRGHQAKELLISGFLLTNL